APPYCRPAHDSTRPSRPLCITCARAEQSVQRRLPRFRRRHYQPRYLSSHGLRRLLLVTPEHELIPAVLLPRPGLKPDGRRVLAGLYNRIPLRPGRKRLGHGLLDDLLQGHASSRPGSVRPTPTSSSVPSILTASANLAAHSRRRARPLSSSGVIYASDGPSAETTARTWLLCVGCTMPVISVMLVHLRHVLFAWRQPRWVHPSHHLAPRPRTYLLGDADNERREGAPS